VMGPGQNFLTRVGSGQPLMVWDRIWKISPIKMPNFSIFFPSGLKKLLWVGSERTRVRAGSAFYLLRVKSKLGSDRVGSGQRPSLDCWFWCCWYVDGPGWVSNHGHLGVSWLRYLIVIMPVKSCWSDHQLLTL